MTVSVHRLTGGQIPVSYRSPTVEAVWLVISGGREFICTSESEAHALAESLREQEYQHSLQLADEAADEDYDPDPPRSRGPGMGM